MNRCAGLLESRYNDETDRKDCETDQMWSFQGDNQF